MGMSAKVGAGSFDAVRVVWHDHPEKWFEEDVRGRDSASRQGAAVVARLEIAR